MSERPQLPPTDPLEIARYQMGNLPVPVVLTELLNATLAAPIESMNDADLNAAERIAAVTLARARMARQRLKKILVQHWAPPTPPPFQHQALRYERCDGEYDAHIAEAFALGSEAIIAVADIARSGMEMVICGSAIADPLGVSVVFLTPPANKTNACK